MQDERSQGEKLAWRMLGPPLYYCATCMRKVNVTVADGQPVISRNCTHDGHQVIAPRRAVVAGEGGLSTVNKVKMAWWSAAAKVTGRNV